MRRIASVLVLTALVAACGEQPAQPQPESPQLAAVGAPHGAWIVRWSEESMFCTFWDYSGNAVFSACWSSYTDNPTQLIQSRYFSKGRVANPTGHPVFFGPENAPQSTIDFYRDGLGVTPTPEGLMPLCDMNIHEYPEAWMEWPVPADELEHLICTTNWHYTLSTAGKATLIVVGDPQHSWRPFAQ